MDSAGSEPLRYHEKTVVLLSSKTATAPRLSTDEKHHSRPKLTDEVKRLSLSAHDASCVVPPDLPPILVQ